MESKLKIIAISFLGIVTIGCATSPSTTRPTLGPDGLPLEETTEGTTVIDTGPKYVIAQEAQAATEAPAYMGVDGGTLSPEESATAKRKASVTLVNKGKKALFNNQYAIANKELQSALSIDSQNPHAYYYLALLEYRQGQYQQALVHLQNAKVHFADPKWKAESHVMAGRIEEDLRDWHGAANEYGKALNYTPGLVPAEEGLGRVQGRITSFETLPGEPGSEIESGERMPATGEQPGYHDSGE